MEANLEKMEAADLKGNPEEMESKVESGTGECGVVGPLRSGRKTY
jgi:hypothetical protein